MADPTTRRYLASKDSILQLGGRRQLPIFPSFFKHLVGHLEFQSVLWDVNMNPAALFMPGVTLSKDKKIRYCVFEADETKMLNCVPASAAAPHIETSIKRHQYPT